MLDVCCPPVRHPVDRVLLCDRVDRVAAKLQSFREVRTVDQSSSLFAFLQRYVDAGCKAAADPPFSLALTAAAEIVHPARSATYLEYLQLMPPPPTLIRTLEASARSKVLPVLPEDVCVDTFTHGLPMYEVLLWYGACCLERASAEGFPSLAGALRSTAGLSHDLNVLALPTCG